MRDDDSFLILPFNLMTTKRKDSMEQKRKRRWLTLETGDLLPVLLLLPTLFVVTIVMIIPLIYGSYISLFNYRIGAPFNNENFIGLGNYIKSLKDPIMWQSMKNTLLFAFLATTGDLVIGTIIAVILLRIRSIFKNVLRAVYLIPLLVSPIIIGLIWKYMLDPSSGPIYWMLSWFGWNIKQFPGVTDSSTALICVVIAHWWQVVPFVILVVTAGLVSIPADLYEAAFLDGAGEFYKFFKISFPLLANVYMVILVTSGVDTLKVFDIIYALTGGGPANSTLSLSLYAYKTAFTANNMGYATAISMLTMLATFLVFGIPFIRFSRREN